MTETQESRKTAEAVADQARWEQVRARLRAAVGEAAFNSWLRPLALTQAAAAGRGTW